MRVWIALLLLLSNAVVTSLMTCESKGTGYFKFASKTVTTAKVGVASNFPGRCFENIRVMVTETPTEYVAELIATNHVGGVCIEFIIVSSGKSSDYKLMYLPGRFNLHFSKQEMTGFEINHIKEKGFFVLLSCGDMKDLPTNIFMTLKMFLGGVGTEPHIPIFGSKIPDYQLKANLDFSEKNIGHKWSLRETPKIVVIDKKNIRSGDYFAIIRFDGVDNIIEWGTGSRSGHNSMALWHEGELYMVESQDGWYWPRRGIQKNKYEDWIRYANNCDMNVVHMPLRDDLREKFDEAKAWAAFKELEGHPYGYSNFLFGWLDTPADNLPSMLDMVFLSILLKIGEKIMPKPITLMFYDAWNIRLGTNNLSMDGIWEELYKRDMTLGELSAMPEKEGWEYPTGPNYVCSAFIVHMYKMVGLFGDVEINSTEFTPRDLYELDFFDVSGKNVPPECAGFAPNGYCQIMGKVHLDLGKLSYVKPYNNMNERCPSMAPFFERPDNC